MPIALRALLFTLVVPGTIGGLIPWVLAAAARDRLDPGIGQPADLGPLHLVGWLLVAAGVLGYGWCAVDFVRRGRGTPNPLDPPRRFVAVGLYRFVRNPMYVSVGLAILGQAIVHGSAVLVVYLGIAWLVVHLFVVLVEEPLLARRFGGEYDAYRARVPRWLPRPPCEA
jgi:protein-S-isoprenylcysteine O-methyltransferase Ste14